MGAWEHGVVCAKVLFADSRVDPDHRAGDRPVDADLGCYGKPSRLVDDSVVSPVDL